MYVVDSFHGVFFYSVYGIINLANILVLYKESLFSQSRTGRMIKHQIVMKLTSAEKRQEEKRRDFNHDLEA